MPKEIFDKEGGPKKSDTCSTIDLNENESMSADQNQKEDEYRNSHEKDSEIKQQDESMEISIETEQANELKASTPSPQKQPSMNTVIKNVLLPDQNSTPILKQNSSPFVIHISPEKYSVNDYYIEPTRRINLNTSKTSSTDSIKRHSIPPSQECEEQLFQSIQPQFTNSLNLLNSLSEGSLPPSYTNSFPLKDTKNGPKHTTFTEIQAQMETVRYSPRPHLRLRCEDQSRYVPFTPVLQDQARQKQSSYEDQKRVFKELDFVVIQKVVMVKRANE